MKKIAAITASLILTSCSANSGIVDLGGGNYFVSRQASTGFGGLGTLRADALREATDVCRAKNKAVSVTKDDQSKEPYILGNFPRVDLTFRCE
jgi:hypothetical protein